MEKDAAVDTIHNPPSKRSKTMASESRRSEEGPSENVTLASTVANGTNNNENKKKEQQQQASRHLPSMIVFDLDDCLWTPEMHELPGTPELPVYGDLTPTSQNGRDDSSTAAASSAMNGVIGMQVPSHSSSRRRRGGRSRNDVTVTLHDGARQVLYELATNPIYKDIVLATASSSLEPSYSYTCLDGIEILPNTTIANLMSFNQIGRTGHLSSNKATHFYHLQKESGIPYEEMIFFDDCNWGDHCKQMKEEVGVAVTQRTPNGLQWDEFQQALSEYHEYCCDRDRKIEREEGKYREEK